MTLKKCAWEFGEGFQEEDSLPSKAIDRIEVVVEGL